MVLRLFVLINLVSTKRMTVVKFVSCEVVGGIQAKALGIEFGAEFLLFRGKTLELGLGRYIPRLAIQVVVHAGGDDFHDSGRVLQFHSSGKLGLGVTGVRGVGGRAKDGRGKAKFYVSCPGKKAANHAPLTFEILQLGDEPEHLGCDGENRRQHRRFD